MIASLGTADDAAGEARGVLGEITDQMSAPDVAEHLGQVLDRLVLLRGMLRPGQKLRIYVRDPQAPGGVRFHGEYVGNGKGIRP